MATKRKTANKQTTRRASAAKKGGARAARKKATTAATKAPQAGKPGRPPGARTKKWEIVETVPAACPKCGSTKRAPYKGSPIEKAILGERGGRMFTHVVWRRTHCLQCGQHRKDKSFENRGSGAE